MCCIVGQVGILAGVDGNDQGFCSLQWKMFCKNWTIGAEVSFRVFRNTGLVQLCTWTWHWPNFLGL